MTIKKIEIASYGVVGAGFGIAGAIVIGIATQASLAGQPTKLASFDGVYWSKTIPWLTVVSAVVAPATHCMVIALRKSLLDQDVERGYQLAPRQDQPATNQPPTNHQQATNQTLTNRQLVAPSQQVGEAVFPVQEAQFTNQNQQDEINRKYKNDLIATLSGDGSFGSN